MAFATDHFWNDPSYWSEAAEQAFSKARRRASRATIADRLRGRRSTLEPFETAATRSGLLAGGAEHRKTVALSRIVGSVGKSRLFTRSFLPKSERQRARWKTAFAVAHGLKGYEPIELYEAAGRFYVVDGHFRVSVARALGFETIQARVRSWA